MAMEIFKLMGTIAIAKDKALQDIKAVQDQAQKASTAMGNSFTKFSGYIEKHSDQIKKAGKYMTVFGGIATAAFVLSVKSAAAFEEQLANVSTMLDESAMKILPEYREGLQSLSVAFGESTETLSKGLYDILSASIPPAKALSVLEISAKAAAAGITDTGVAADAITTILNSYGMSADQAGMVSDKLFAIVKEGKTTFAELAPSIGKVAATASMAGLSFDDLGACIATMTRAGIRTEETMTAINGVLIAFLKPTDEAVEAAAKFGLTLDTNTLKTEGLTGVMEKLKDATAEQLAAIFPNIRGLKGMAAALGDAEGYARSYALMLNSAGLTQEAFEKQSATLNFKLGQLKEMFNVIKVVVGDALIPAVEDLIKKGMEVLKGVKEWTEANKPLTETIVKWAAGIGVALLVLGPLLVMLPGLIAGIHLLSGAFLPFLIGGAIIFGIKKLSDYMGEIKEKAFEIATGFKDWPLDVLNVKILEMEGTVSDLSAELAEAEKEFKLFGITIKNQDVNVDRLKQVIKDYGIQLGLLKEQRKELTGAEKEGIDVTEEKLKLDKEIAEMQDEINKKLEEERKAFEGKVKAEEAANAEKEIGNRIAELSLEPMENSVRLLDEQKQKYIELGAEVGLINEWYDLEIKRLKELYKVKEEEINVTKLLSLEMQILTAQYKLTNQTAEVTIKYYQDMLGVAEELAEVKKAEMDALIEGTPEWKEANLAYLESKIVVKDLGETINELNQVRNEELEGLELIRAKLDLLSKQYQVIEKDADYYRNMLSLLGEEYEELTKTIAELEGRGEEWTDELVKIKGELYANEEATEALKEEWEEFNTVQSDTLTGIELINAELMLLEARYEGIAKDQDYVTKKTSLLNEKYRLLNKALAETEFHSAEWFELTKNIIAVETELDNLADALESTGVRWRTFFAELKASYGDTISILQDGISGFVSSFEGAISNAITSLFTMAETNAKIKEEMAKLEEEYTDEMAALQEEYNQAVMAGDDAAAENALQNIADLKEEHEQAMQDMSDDMVTKEDIWKTFWGNIKTAAINALAEIIAKQAISVLLSWGWAGWLLLGLAAIYAIFTSAGKSLGGEVAKQAMAIGGEIAEFAKGGLLKGFQAGGGTDNVLIRATPGEYVVSKPMTDFIKRTGIVTSDLINAIRMGTRTPTPSFAVGGAVPPVVSNPVSNQVNIEEISVSIFAQELNDETIANAGDKIFVELKKQFGMRGLALMEE